MNKLASWFEIFLHARAENSQVQVWKWVTSALVPFTHLRLNNLIQE